MCSEPCDSPSEERTWKQVLGAEAEAAHTPTRSHSQTQPEFNVAVTVSSLLLDGLAALANEVHDLPKEPVLHLPVADRSIRRPAGRGARHDVHAVLRVPA